jgi:ribosome-associated heat shock protein Hsp15
LSETPDSIRLDKWLWHARFFKSRSLAAGVVTAGKVRVDGTPVSKPARSVGPSHVLTFSKEGDVRVVRILACGIRRGPAPEAQALYEDLTPAPAPRPVAAQGANPRYDGGGRPTKKDRRDMGL